MAHHGYYYGAAGRKQLERVGASPGEARNRLAEAMRDHCEQLGYGRITRSTKLIDLAAELPVEMDGDDAYTEGNVEDYRREIYVSADHKRTQERSRSGIRSAICRSGRRHRASWIVI